MAVLQNNRTFALVIWGQVMNKEEKLSEYPSNFHIGFYQDNENEVMRIYEKIRYEEYVRVDGKSKKMRNTYGFYFYFENLMIEITVNLFNSEY